MKKSLASDQFKNDLIDALKQSIERTVQSWVGEIAAGHILELECNFFGENLDALDNIQCNISLGIFGDAELLQEAKEIDDAEPFPCHSEYYRDPAMTWERVVDEIPGIND